MISQASLLRWFWRSRRFMPGSRGSEISAIKAQADQLSFAHTGFFTSEPAEELTELLIKHAPGELDRVYLVSGGSEAAEAAIKLDSFILKMEPKSTPYGANKAITETLLAH